MADNEIKTQVDALKKNIKDIYNRRRASAIGLCLDYAGMALKEFRRRQAHGLNSPGEFWTNRLGVAADTVFGDAIIANDYIGFFLAHTEEYGVYLELANDRKYQGLLPSVMRFYSRFVRDMEELYAA